MKEKKEALIVLSVALPLLCYGGFSFELGGGGSVARSIAIAVSITLGLAGVIGGLVLFFTKNSLGLIGTKAKPDSRRIRSPEDLINLTIDDEFNKLRAKATKPKPIIKEEKEMVKTKEEKPVEKSGSESISMMLREKELVKRADELTTLVNEVETELNQVRENLETKGWIQSADGWIIE